jgi:hypothetical protein
VVVVVDEPGGGFGTTTVAGAGSTTTRGGCVVRSSVQEKQPLAIIQTPRAIKNIKVRWLIGLLVFTPLVLLHRNSTKTK